MALPAEKIFRNLTDFWSNMNREDREAISAIWQALQERRIDLQMAAQAINRSKGILGVPVLVEGFNVPLTFKTANTLSETRLGFPFGFSIDRDLEEIPTLQSDLREITPDDGPTILTAGVDYTLESQKIFFAVKPPEFLIAPTLKRNLELIRDIFGLLLDFIRANSIKYRRQVQGIWFALFGGASVSNLSLGMTAIIDFPYTRGGLVKAIRPQSDGSAKVFIADEVIDVPAHLVPRLTVEVGDQVDGSLIGGFRPITDAVSVEDYIINPDFATRAGIPEILKFFTFMVTVDADDVVELIGPLGSLQDLFSGDVEFIERGKPAYTDFILDVLKDLKVEELQVATDATPRVVEIRLPSDLAFNPVNVHFGIDGFGVDLGSLDELAYIAIGNDERLDLGNDSLAFKEWLVIQDIGGGLADQFIGEGP